jgi:hypothetical protein
MSQNENQQYQPDIASGNDLQFPRVSISYWRFHNTSWRVYQLPNGAKLMSDRQMAQLVSQPKKTVREFIELHNLEMMDVRVENGKVIRVYPLSVAAIYLSKLLTDGDLDKHPLAISRQQWHSLIKALCKKESGRINMPNPCFFTGDYRVEMANSFLVELDINIRIQMLVLDSGEYYVEYKEGLRCIQHNLNWLVNYSPKKARILSALKLSKDIVECRVKIQEEFKSMYALSLSDWLSVWGYFVNKGNRYAIALLKACAKSGIDVLINKAIEEGET